VKCSWRARFDGEKKKKVPVDGVRQGKQCKGKRSSDRQEAIDFHLGGVPVGIEDQRWVSAVRRKPSGKKKKKRARATVSLYLPRKKSSVKKKSLSSAWGGEGAWKVSVIKMHSEATIPVQIKSGGPEGGEWKKRLLEDEKRNYFSIPNPKEELPIRRSGEEPEKGKVKGTINMTESHI